MSLQQSGRIELAFEPDDLTYPAAETTVRMQPLRLSVGRSPLLRQLLATLAVVDKWVPVTEVLKLDGAVCSFAKMHVICRSAF